MVSLKTSYMSPETQAYKEGYDAYENGFVKNPYAYDDVGHRDWEEGWVDAWNDWNDHPA